MDDNITSTYRELYGQHGLSARALGWGNEDRQHTRFSVLLKANLTNVQSVLDVGSGLGDLVPHLRFAKARLKDYMGVEAMPEFVNYAKLAYPEPNINFHEGDVRDMEVLPQYDLVISSGLLGWYGLNDALGLIDLMWSKAKRVLAFNFSTVTTSLRPEYMVTVAGRADGGFVIRNDYLSGDDYTVYMYRG